MPVLGLIELIFIGVFFLLMVIGTSLDRRYNESPKWWFLAIAMVIAVVYFWGQTDFSSIWAAVQSWTFWQPFATYLGAGLIYSVLEFILSVRKMERSHSASWNKFINRVDTVYTIKTDSGEEDKVEANWVTQNGDRYVITINSHGNRTRDGAVEKEVTRTDTAFRDVFKAAQSVDATTDQKKAAREMLHRYLHGDEYRLSDLRKDFVEVELSPSFEVQPVVNRGRLASFIGAWVFLWPAYAVSLILGDFLVEVFRVIGDVFSRIGGRFVRMTFSDTFKV